jgi:hypothetical protein
MNDATKFVVLNDENETIGSADTLSKARDLIDTHVREKYGIEGLHNGFASMRNYGAQKDAAGMWSEMLEMKLGPYDHRAFIVLMPAGYDPRRDGWTL